MAVGTGDCTFRQAKERFYFWQLAVGKQLDAAVMQEQMKNLRAEITKAAFVERATRTVKIRDTDVDELMKDLQIEGLGASKSEVMLSTAKADTMYSSIMQRIGTKRRADAEAKAKSAETMAKQVEKLRDANPEDLLAITVERSVVSTMQAHGVIKKEVRTQKEVTKQPRHVNWSKAYDLAMRDPSRLAEAVQEQQPTSGKGKKVVQNTPKGKAKEKGAKAQGKGKGKGKSPKGKGKVKGKGKSKGKDYQDTRKGNQKGKGKGKS